MWIVFAAHCLASTVLGTLFSVRIVCALMLLAVVEAVAVWAADFPNAWLFLLALLVMTNVCYAFGVVVRAVSEHSAKHLGSGPKARSASSDSL